MLVLGTPSFDYRSHTWQAPEDFRRRERNVKEETNKGVRLELTQHLRYQ
jgi:hypothetical protein